MQPISLLILGSVFSECVVFYGDTVLGVYLKRAYSRVTSAYSALGVLNDYAPHKSTHSLTHSLTHTVARLSAFEMTALRTILRVSKKTN